MTTGAGAEILGFSGYREGEIGRLHSGFKPPVGNECWFGEVNNGKHCVQFNSYYVSGESVRGYGGEYKDHPNGFPPLCSALYPRCPAGMIDPDDNPFTLETCIVPGPPSPPPAPFARAIHAPQSAALISWSAPVSLNGSTVSAYEILREADGSGVFVSVAAVSMVARSDNLFDLFGPGLVSPVFWQDVSVTVGATLRYRVRVRSNLGVGAESESSAAVFIPANCAAQGRVTTADPLACGGCLSRYEADAGACVNAGTGLSADELLALYFPADNTGRFCIAAGANYDYPVSQSGNTVGRECEISGLGNHCVQFNDLHQPGIEVSGANGGYNSDALRRGFPPLCSVRYPSCPQGTADLDGNLFTQDECVVPGPPSGPVSLSVQKFPQNEALLFWSVPVSLNGAVISGYEVLREADGSGTFVSVAFVTVGLSYLDSDTTLGATLRYKARARSDLGVGADSATVTAVISNCAAAGRATASQDPLVCGECLSRYREESGQCVNAGTGLSADSLLTLYFPARGPDFCQASGGYSDGLNSSYRGYGGDVGYECYFSGYNDGDHCVQFNSGHAPGGGVFGDFSEYYSPLTGNYEDRSYSTHPDGFPPLCSERYPLCPEGLVDADDNPFTQEECVALGPPSQPENPSAIVRPDNTVAFSWSRPVSLNGAAISGYEVLREADGSGTFISVAFTADLSHLDSDATVGATLRYKARARSDQGPSPESEATAPVTIFYDCAAENKLSTSDPLTCGECLPRHVAEAGACVNQGASRPADELLELYFPAANPGELCRTGFGSGYSRYESVRAQNRGIVVGYECYDDNFSPGVDSGESDNCIQFNSQYVDGERVAGRDHYFSSDQLPPLCSERYPLCPDGTEDADRNPFTQEECIVPAPPSRPREMFAGLVANNHVRLSWSVPASLNGAVISGYEILREAGGSGTFVSVAFVTGRLWHLDSDTTLGATLRYKARARSSQGASPDSATVAAVISNCAATGRATASQDPLVCGECLSRYREESGQCVNAGTGLPADSLLTLYFPIGGRGEFCDGAPGGRNSFLRQFGNSVGYECWFGNFNNGDHCVQFNSRYLPGAAMTGYTSREYHAHPNGFPPLCSERYPLCSDGLVDGDRNPFTQEECVALGPPSQPENPSATVRPDNTVAFSWSAPVSLNGAVISGYEVLREADGSGTFVSVAFVLGGSFASRTRTQSVGATLRYKARAHSDQGPSPESEASAPVTIFYDCAAENKLPTSNPLTCGECLPRHVAEANACVNQGASRPADELVELYFPAANRGALCQGGVGFYQAVEVVRPMSYERRGIVVGYECYGDYFFSRADPDEIRRCIQFNSQYVDGEGVEGGGSPYYSSEQLPPLCSARYPLCPDGTEDADRNPFTQEECVVPAAPSRPENPSARVNSDNTVEFSWSEPVSLNGAAISGYEILREADGSGTFVSVAFVSVAAGLSHTDSDATVGATLRYKARARSDQGPSPESEASAPVVIHRDCAAEKRHAVSDPAACGECFARHAAASAGDVCAPVNTGAGLSAEALLELYFPADDYGRLCGALHTPYQVRSAGSGMAVGYECYAYSSSGRDGCVQFNSDYQSGEGVFGNNYYASDNLPPLCSARYPLCPEGTTDADRNPFTQGACVVPAPPSRPENPFAIVLPDNTVEFSWSAPASLNGALISGYEILRESDGSGSFVSVAFVSVAAGLSHADSDATVGATLRYKARARSDRGLGALSAASNPVVIVRDCAAEKRHAATDPAACGECFARHAAASAGSVCAPVNTGAGLSAEALLELYFPADDYGRLCGAFHSPASVRSAVSDMEVGYECHAYSFDGRDDSCVQFNGDYQAGEDVSGYNYHASDNLPPLCSERYPLCPIGMTDADRNPFAQGACVVPAPPSRPENPSAIVRQDDTVEFSWEEPASLNGALISGYEILREADGSGSFVSVAFVSAAAGLSHADSDTTVGATLRYKARARSDQGPGPQSEASNLAVIYRDCAAEKRLPDTNSPATCGECLARYATTGGGSVCMPMYSGAGLSADALLELYFPADAYYRLCPGSVFTVSSNSRGAEVGYECRFHSSGRQDSCVQFNGDYQDGEDVSGSEDYASKDPPPRCSERHALCPAGTADADRNPFTQGECIVPAAPSAPRNPSARVNADDTVEFLWSEPASFNGAAISGYEILRESDGSGNFVSVAFVSAAAGLLHADSDTTVGATLRYKARAHSDQGLGPESAASNPAVIYRDCAVERRHAVADPLACGECFFRHAAANSEDACAPINAGAGLSADALLELYFPADDYSRLCRAHYFVSQVFSVARGALVGYECRSYYGSQGGCVQLNSQYANGEEVDGNNRYASDNLPPLCSARYPLCPEGTTDADRNPFTQEECVALGPPSRPENPSATVLPDNTVEFSWSEPISLNGAAISGYEILRESDGSGNFVSVAFVSVAARLSHADFDATVGATLRYKARARSDQGLGAESEASAPAVIVRDCAAEKRRASADPAACGECLPRHAAASSGSACAPVNAGAGLFAETLLELYFPADDYSRFCREESRSAFAAYSVARNVEVGYECHFDSSNGGDNCVQFNSRHRPGEGVSGYNYYAPENLPPLCSERYPLCPDGMKDADGNPFTQDECVAPAAPSRPENPSATLRADGAVEFSWSAPASLNGAAISGYEILREADGSGTFVSVAFVSVAAGLSHTDSDATVGATLRYKARARSDQGPGPESEATAPVTIYRDCAAEKRRSGSDPVDCGECFARHTAASAGDACAPTDSGEGLSADALLELYFPADDYSRFCGTHSAHWIFAGNRGAEVGYECHFDSADGRDGCVQFNSRYRIGEHVSGRSLYTHKNLPPLCSERYPPCPDGMKDADGNLFTQDECVAPAAPSRPENPSATLRADGAVEFSWSAPASLNGAAISGYEVLREADGSGNFVSVAFVSAAPAAALVSVMSASVRLSHLDSDAALGATLRYRARAHSDQGPSSQSAASAPVIVFRDCAAENRLQASDPLACGKCLPRHEAAGGGGACAPINTGADLPADALLELYFPARDSSRFCGDILRSAIPVRSENRGMQVGYECRSFFGGRGGCVQFNSRYRAGENLHGADYYVFPNIPPLCSERYPSCPAGMEDADGNMFTQEACVGPQMVAYSHDPMDGSGGTLTVLALASGETVPHGSTVTFMAIPAAGWTIAAWGGDGAGCAASALECELTAVADLRVTVQFAEAEAVGRCGEVSAEGQVQEFVRFGGQCVPAVNVDYAHTPPDGTGGTLTAAGLIGGLAVQRATVTFTATPAAGWTIAAWEGGGAGCATDETECELTADGGLFVTVRFAVNCAAQNRQNAPGDETACGECLDDYGELGGRCISNTGDFGDIPQSEICLALQGGGNDAQLAGNGRVCSGVDANGTFCILDSRDGLPCRGLFRHVLRCNLEFERLALNPFFCGRRCQGEEKAVGDKCVEQNE